MGHYMATTYFDYNANGVLYAMAKDIAANNVHSNLETSS